MTENDALSLLTWYRANRRNLPWRDTGNPEDVWISEIMLQQTRVEAVRRYFTRFREALPGCAAIAACPEDRLMKLWEGLGYYSRAGNIQKCARVLVRDHGGKLPADFNALLKLPGIGPYTAGAIASIAFGLPYPAVDGNVLRVYARLEGRADDIGRPETREAFSEELRALILRLSGPGFSVSDFNQALMELGAVVCLPNGAPLCLSDPEACPLSQYCAAYRSGRTAELPVKAPKRARRTEQRTLLVIRDGDRFLFRKRPEKGLLAGLYEFPGFDGFLTEEQALQEVRSLGLIPLHIAPLPEGKHIFTHVEWQMKAYEVRIAEFPDTETRSSILLVPKEALSGLAVPSAFRTWTDWYALKE